MRSGYVAVIGRANAGKSTLINVMVGEKVSIVSPKPQTTRDRILGVLTEEEYQIVFVDTPGIYKARNALTDMMMRTTETSARDVDFLLYVVDGHNGLTDEDFDLMKKYKGDARIDFLRVSSYEGTESTGKIVLKLPLKEENIKDKHVLIVEDIVDTGYTLEFLRNYVNGMNPKSVRECTLLNKQARRIVDIKPEFVGFDIEDLFVIGYGLDYNQKYRNLPYIGVVSND